MPQLENVRCTGSLKHFCLRKGFYKMKTIQDLINKYLKLSKQYETITIAQVLLDLRFLQSQNKRVKNNLPVTEPPDYINNGTA